MKNNILWLIFVSACAQGLHNSKSPPQVTNNPSPRDESCQLSLTHREDLVGKFKINEFLIKLSEVVENSCGEKLEDLQLNTFLEKHYQLNCIKQLCIVKEK